MRLIKIKRNGDLVGYKKNDIDFIIKNKNIDKLHTWKLQNEIQFILYGSIDGKAGKENKYELAPPLDNSLFFDVLYVVKYQNEKFCDLTLDEYNKFYEDSYGGFENIDMTDDESEETLSEHTSDRDFIDDDTISEMSSNQDITSSILSTISNPSLNKINEKESSDDSDNESESDHVDLMSSIEITISDESMSDADTDQEN